MLMRGVLFFREEIETTDSLRAGLLASSVLEGIQLWHSEVRDSRVRVALKRGEEFLRIAAAFCTGGFKTTSEGISSTEAFTRVVAAFSEEVDIKTMGRALEDYAALLKSAVDGRDVDLRSVQAVFVKIASDLVKDRFSGGAGSEKWRL